MDDKADKEASEMITDEMLERMTAAILKETGEFFLRDEARKLASIALEAAGVGEMRAALEGAQVLIESLYAGIGRDPSNSDSYCKIVDLLKEKA